MEDISIPMVIMICIEFGAVEEIQRAAELHSDVFTPEYVEQFIQYAIRKEQHEVYTFLVNYKAEHIGFQEIDERLKL